MMNRVLFNKLLCSKCFLRKSDPSGSVGVGLAFGKYYYSCSRTVPLKTPSTNKNISNTNTLTSRRHLSDALHASKGPEDVIRFNSEDFKFIEDDIKKELDTSRIELKEISQYHFNGAGKYIRPMIAMLMSQACNQDHTQINDSQKEVATIVEMIHTASLVHDDVIDASNLRRGKHTAHHLWGQKKAVLAGDYILSTASRKLARIGNVEVVQVLSKVLEDLVTGEFMQLGSKEGDTERFNHYMKKTYKKTASLIANSCKAVAILADGQTKNMVEIAYQYGRNVGIAFQLIDDYLDFVAAESSMGKPVCADLRLGLATAPVLYASMQHPELNAMIMRRFARPGDVEMARKFVEQSNGVEHTMLLAKQHCNEAIEQVKLLEKSRASRSLIDITEKILKRTK